MDNMVHIGHDTIIGRNCLFAAQVAVAGAVEIGEGVILWGQVGVSKTLTIGAHAVVLSQSGVAGSLEGGRTYFGTPAMDALQKKRELVWVKRISEMWDRLIALERRSNDGGHSGS
jgi:UDP-3-O-[3-hydroxymyristoyl] glucosamine N-acyltransferase